MFNQVKYSVRQHLNQRSIALGGTILLNVVFGICGAMGLYGSGGKITAVVFSSLALCALVVVNIVADCACVRDLFAAPMGYNAFLTPVPRWKMLLGRVLPIVVMDLVSLFIGVVALVVQSVILVGQYATNDNSDLNELGWYAVILLINYLLLILVLFFFSALTHSVFFRLKGRGFLAVLTVTAVLYGLSWLDLLLGFFGNVQRMWMFIGVTLNVGLNAGMILWIVLGLLKVAALFSTTAYLMERKINL